MQRASESTSRISPVVGDSNRIQHQCEKHGEYHAAVRTVNGEQQVSLCPQCLAEQTAEEARRDSIAIDRQRQQAQQQSLTELLGYAGVPPRFIRRGFDTFDAYNDELKALARTCREYAEAFDSNLHQGRGLLMIGKTGTGKTHLAASICKAVIRAGYHGVFISTLHLTQVVKESYSGASESSELKAMLKFIQPDLLVVDEIGVQHRTRVEWMILTEIMNRRYEQDKPTILLSNLPIENPGTQEDLLTVLGERVISRLREVNELLTFSFEDYRGRAAC